MDIHKATVLEEIGQKSCPSNNFLSTAFAIAEVKIHTQAHRAPVLLIQRNGEKERTTLRIYSAAGPRLLALSPQPCLSLHKHTQN